jgi:hypothetical protein
MITTNHCSLVKYTAMTSVMGAVPYLARATDGPTVKKADDASPAQATTR